MCFAVGGVLKAFCVVVLTCFERNLGHICDSIGNHMVLKKIYKKYSIIDCPNVWELMSVLMPMST